MRRSIHLACGLGLALLLGACGGETEVRLVFPPFACPQALPVMKSLSVFVAERVLRSEHPETLRRLAEPECLNTTMPMISDALANYFRQRGQIVQGVPVDKETRVVLLLHVEAACATTGPTPVCLPSDPIASGGRSQEIAVHAECAPSSGQGGPLWQMCMSVLVGS